MDLFKKIIDEATTIDLIGPYVLTGLGEPALDPYLVERVAYIRKKSPGAQIQFFTNGINMTPAKLDALYDAGITSIIFSLNAVTQEQHERVMGVKDKFDIVCRNILYAIENCPGIDIHVRAVFSRDDFTMDDVDAFYKRWGHKGKGGHGQCVHEGNWSGGNRTMRTFEPNECCARALGHMYVMHDGRMTTCCFDPTGKQVFGDLNTQTIREVYNGVDYVSFREAHNKNEADKYPQCKECSRI
jgi:hypothetical protein